MQPDILKRINNFAASHHVPINDIKLRITQQIAQKYSTQEEDTPITSKTVESAFEKVMKELEKKGY